VASLLLSVAFGLPLLGASTFDLFLGRIQPETPLSFTLRLPGVGVYKDTMHSGRTFRHIRLIHPRGYVLDQTELELVQAHEEMRRPPRAPLLVGLALLFLAVVFFLSRFAAADSRQGAELRTQLVLLGLLFLTVAGAKLFLVLTALSAMWIPLSLAVIPVARHLGHRLAGAVAVAGALLLGFHTPIDLTLMLVLLGQGLTAAILPGRTGALRIVGAALGASVGAGLACVATALVLDNRLPTFQSGFLPATAAGLGGGLLALLATPAFGLLLGIINKARLLSLANLDTPLLKQLSTKAPGTWGHSMAMANMAEMAANSIGADGLLVRVGAYYHDLGKAAQPHYFIENQEGENPHDGLSPDVSADAIFSHVTEGVKQARKHKLPRQIIEFIETHHGQGLLEFFWHKNQEADNPKQLAEEDFHYPGGAPQTRETAILSLCDAVEAASRTLEDRSNDRIRKLVRQITLSKVEQGLLSESGLTLAELQHIMESLVETLKSTHHSRIRYPWQEEEGKEVRREKEPREPAQQAGDEAAAEEAGEANSRVRVRTRPLGVDTKLDS
jgi:putative nucleotidyltransferase with HDIG domain